MMDDEERYHVMRLSILVEALVGLVDPPRLAEAVKDVEARRRELARASREGRQDVRPAAQWQALMVGDQANYDLMPPG
jgi:hypothetical protein